MHAAAAANIIASAAVNIAVAAATASTTVRLAAAAAICELQKKLFLLKRVKIVSEIVSEIIEKGITH